MKTAPKFEPILPTKTLTATRGSVTVTTKLYGPVSPERLVKEQRATEYRAEQLVPVQKRPERIETFRERTFTTDRMESLDDRY